MKKLLGLTLGIMTALGGFVDLGQIVFTTQAGALFGYQLLWSIVIGTLAIIVYMEMCGRVAVVAGEPVFAVIRDRLSKPLGIITLVASNLLNLLTCAAELGGVAIIIHLLTGWPEKLVLLGVGLILPLIVYVSRFQWIERTFGLSGLLMIVFAVSAVVLHPDWHALGRGLNPYVHLAGRHQALLYAYFAVGIFSAMLMEYEVHFYSSGAIEEDWKIKDLSENFLVSSFGSALGALLTVALLALGALLFLPHHIFPEQLSSSVLAGAWPYGQKVLVIAGLGTSPASAEPPSRQPYPAPTISASSSTGPGVKTSRANPQRSSPQHGWAVSSWLSSSCWPVSNPSSSSISPSSSAWRSCLSPTTRSSASPPTKTSWANTPIAASTRSSARSFSSSSSSLQPLPFR